VPFLRTRVRSEKIKSKWKLKAAVFPNIGKLKDLVLNENFPVLLSKN
jgi:hypothetical protein